MLNCKCLACFPFVFSSDDDVEAALQGDQQKQACLQNSDKRKNNDEDQDAFEKEMNAELNDTMKSLENKRSKLTVNQVAAELMTVISWGTKGINRKKCTGTIWMYLSTEDDSLSPFKLLLYAYLNQDPGLSKSLPNKDR